MTKQSTSFWNFSNQLYAREGVADACLALQEQFHLDVNLVLFCFWSAHCHASVSDEEWQQILEFSTQWNSHVVQPLRNVRIWMKTGAENQAKNKGIQIETLRNRIKLDELAAEKIQQERIEDLVPNLLSASVEFNGGVARSNFEKLLRAQSLKINTELDNSFNLIAQAINDSA